MGDLGAWAYAGATSDSKTARTKPVDRRGNNLEWSALIELSLIKTIKVARIYLKNFSDRSGRDPRIVAQQKNGIELGRWIMVTVVGADNQTILTRVAQDVGQIIGVLAGNPHIVRGEGVRRKRPALTPVAVSQIVQNIRHPLRADLNDAPTDLRELFRKLLLEKRMKRADDGQLELGKTRVLGEEVVMEKAAVGGMDADR